LSELEHAVVSKVTRRGRVSKLVHQDMDTQMTFGERVADKVAQFGGSWGFIGLFGGILVVWMLVNAWVLARHPFDPYPFILLNLVLSTLAALQATGHHDESEPAGAQRSQACPAGLRGQSDGGD